MATTNIDSSLLEVINETASSPDDEIMFPERWCAEVDDRKDHNSSESED